MNHSEIAALMKGVAPVIRDLVKAHVAPLEKQIEQLQHQLEAAQQVDFAEVASRMVGDAVAALPPPPAAQEVDMEAVARLVDDSVAKAIPTIDLPDFGAMVEASVAKAIGSIPLPKDGESVTPEQIEPMLAKMVEDAVSALPKPEDGKSVTTDDVAPLIEQEVAKAVAAIPVPEKGDPGPVGKLPLAKAWDGEVTYEAEVRTHNGALWQAVRDTGREPGHEDWICLAVAGSPGKDADQIEIAGTFDPGKANAYRRLNIVALNGGAFIAKRDAPGECPGEGWQVIAMRGKSGPPGQSVKGDPGKSIKGDPGEAVVSMSIDGQGMLTLVNGDGSEVECDLYPVLSKIGGR